MLCIGYDWKNRMIKDCNSGKRNHLQSWPTSQYQEIALTVWLLKTEIEYISKGLRHRGTHPRSLWSGIGKASSSSSKCSSRSSHFTHIRTLYLEAESDLRKQGRSATRLVTHSRRGPRTGKPGAIHFSNECGYSSQWPRSQHNCTREERSCERRTHRYEYKGHWKNPAEIWRRRRWCLAEHPATLFSRSTLYC